MSCKRFILLLFIFSYQFIFSQDFDFNVSAIPDSLKRDAKAVVRFYDTNIEFESSKKMTIKVKKAITILNKLGDKNSRLSFNYDKSNHIKKIKISVFDASGDKIKDISKKEIKDYHAADGISLFNDGRLKYYKHVPISYPYTIFYEYEKESINTAFIPRWFPLNSFNQSVQKSTFKISFPTTLFMQKVEKNFKKFNILKSQGPNYLSFEMSNTPAIKYEELCPSFIDIMPWLRLASNKFHLEGVDGKADNWEEFGKWMYDNLIASRMDLPESTKTKIKDLVKGIEDPIKKAKIVYEYVQNKTRYISVQVGIGGWMPMLAGDVDRLSYSECKGLTNYTKSLLDVIGVESHHALVYAGYPKQNIENDIVSPQGNHMFLYIPSQGKDIWLECTSQTVPFGYQGTFTDDRDVLVITPDGGKIKHTGIHSDENSFQNTFGIYTIKSTGEIVAEVSISTGGIQYRDHYELEKKTERDIHEHYKSDYWSYINNITINNYDFINNKDSIIFTENVILSTKNYATYSGERMLFSINPFNRLTSIPKRYRKRKLPFEISRGFIDTDSFEITLPEDYSIEALADNVNLNNKYGQYRFSIEKISPTTLKYSRSLNLKNGTYPANEYNGYRNFLKQISKYDKTKIVLIKK